jgi:hypothetical protein
VLPGKVHRVIYEDLVANPGKEVRALFDYLELAFEDASLRFHENDRLVRTASSEQVRRPIFTEALDHWKNFEPWLAPLRTELGFVLETYPAVPRFYSQLHTKLGYSGGWGDADQSWSGRAVQAAKPGSE